ncbi:phage tail length tape measure family protein [Paraburkholderia sp. J41]|uniref:phage tail length tape measure family protein n=1 Tax=Paraburkholderia sp. J41 TaxID=2805433 RepID=UPI002AC31BDE|nr:phage tail length tape measure family protein [Paraburkholderia sp. J41]
MQITMDPSSYNAGAQDLKSGARSTATALGQAGDSGAAAMDKVSSHTAGARKELLVMAHELATGNISNFEGSIMVFAEKIDAFKFLLSPVGAAVTAVVATVGAFALAAIKGHEETERFNNSLVLTGNYAGQTASSFAALAQAISSSTGASLGTAREGLQALVSSGQVTGQSLDVLGQDIVRMHDLTGQSLDDIAKDYAKMPEGVAKWAEQHNTSMHFITTAQYDYIRALEEAGDKQGAMLVVAKALDAQLSGESIPNLGYLERSWKAVGSAISTAWDWMKSIGRDETAAEKIAAATADVQRLQNALKSPSGQMNADLLTPQLQEAQAKLDALNRDALREQNRALDKSQQDQIQQAGIAASDFLKKLQDEERGINRVDDALKDYRKNVAAYNAANPGKAITPAQQATDETFLRKQYADHGADSAANRARKNALDAALATTKNGLDLINAAFKSSDEQLQALRKATLISDETYYQAEITLANDSAQQQIAAYQQEKKTLQDAYWKAPAEDRIKITQEIGDIDTKIAKVRQDNAAKVNLLLTQQTDAQRQYLKSITDTKDALLAQAGISAPKALHDFDERNRGNMLQAATTGDVGTAAFLDQDRQLTRLTAQYSDLMAQASTTSNEISLNQQEGLTGILDSFSQLRTNSADTVDSLKQLYAQVDQLSWQTTDPGVLANLNQLRDKIRQSMLDSSNYVKDFTDAGRTAFDGFFSSITDGTKTPLQALRSMVASMASSLASLFENQAYTGLLNTIFGGSLTSSGGTGGSAFGFSMPSSIAGSGSLFGLAAGTLFKADGGLITGPGTATSDSIPARLSTGEFVVNAHAVSQPGVLALLGAINSGQSVSPRNRFARGGLVGGGSGAAGASSGGDVYISSQTTVQAPASSSGPSTGSGMTAKQLADGIDGRIKQAIARETQQGGIISRYVNGR